jgi:hypothetical protein
MRVISRIVILFELGVLVAYTRCLKLRGQIKPAPNPTIVSYNGSVVKIYNTAGSLVRFESNIMFSSTLKNAL